MLNLVALNFMTYWDRIVIAIKILLQELWLLKDDVPITQDQCCNIDYINDLLHLACVYIPRRIGQYKENILLEAYGFADASSHAYTALVYLRVIHFLINFQISLIWSQDKGRTGQNSLHSSTLGRAVKPTVLMDKAIASFIEYFDL
jgi:hypothetical protein